MKILSSTATILMLLLLPASPAPAHPSGGENRLITISAKDMDIQDFFELLNKQYGLNIVVSKGVTGKISVHLTDVPLDEALDSITWENGYSYARKGDIIRITAAGERKDEAGSGAPAPSPPVETRHFQLKFLEAETAASMVESLLTPAVGSAKGVKDGNILIVRDLPSKIREISELIGKLDAEDLQVRISVKIVLINRTDAESAGFDWVARFRASGAARPVTFPFDKKRTGGAFWPVNNPYGSGGESGTSSGSNFDPGASFPYATKDDFIFGMLDATEFSLLMEFITTKTDSEIVSQPEITTLNNKTAKILNGNVIKIPIYSQNIERATSTFSGYETVETGTNLEVTPRIIDENSVVLKVKPQVSEIVEYRGQFQEAPNVATRNAETTVILEDGKTLIIGGLTRSTKRERKSGIPLLKDIPLLGRLFSYSSEEKVKDDMIIFITPRIINRNIMRKEAEGLMRYRDKWVPRASLEQAARLKAALFGSSPKRRMRGLEALKKTRNEEVLSIVDPEKTLIRVIANDTEPAIRAAAVKLLAEKHPKAYYDWLDSLVLASPAAYDAGFLADFYLSEPARHLRDITLMAAVMADWPGTRDRLLAGLAADSTAVKIRAAEAFSRCPCPEAREGLVEILRKGKDPAAEIYALFALAECGGEGSAAALKAVAAGERGNRLGSLALKALGSLGEKGAPGPSGRLFRESDFQEFLVHLRGASPPAIEGPEPFKARVAAALELLKAKAPQSYDFLCLGTDRIREGEAWSVLETGEAVIVAGGGDVMEWTAQRTAYEAVYHASLLYRRKEFPSGVPEVIEGSRDEFWTACSLAGMDPPPGSRLRRFFAGLLGCRKGPSWKLEKVSLSPGDGPLVNIVEEAE